VFRSLIKSAFQACALQRYQRQFFDGKTVRAINSARPVFFVADEFPAVLSPGSSDDGDAFFLDKAREVKVGCVLSAQGVSALSARMGSDARTYHLLNNCCCKVFMGSDCPETLVYFESSVPETDETKEEILYQALPTPASFRLPIYVFGKSDSWVSKSKTLTHSHKRKFTRASLRQLQMGKPS
jgi:hypothetical protein